MSGDVLAGVHRRGRRSVPGAPAHPALPAAGDHRLPAFSTAIDQTIFQAFGYDPPGYQSYDKAMDVYYLAIAYLATMRNWAMLPAFRIGRFLYFYRLVGRGRVRAAARSARSC